MVDLGGENTTYDLKATRTQSRANLAYQEQDGRVQFAMVLDTSKDNALAAGVFLVLAGLVILALSR